MQWRSWLRRPVAGACAEHRWRAPHSLLSGPESEAKRLRRRFHFWEEKSEENNGNEKSKPEEDLRVGEEAIENLGGVSKDKEESMRRREASRESRPRVRPLSPANDSENHKSNRNLASVVF